MNSDAARPETNATGVHTPKPDLDPPPVAVTADHDTSSQPDLLIAGRYTLQQRIGEGGMGEVWSAKQSEPVKRRVALKLIKPGMDSKAVLQRFEQERQALAMMDHPNIAKVLDAGLTPTGQPFFVMELVSGLPLSRFCDEFKLSLKERLELFVPICQAVQHAHQKGIVHRDLKPANILVTMIDARPVPKVIDFGVAKATAGRLTDLSMSTQFGSVIGTLEYMSPEQAGFSGEDIDTRADIYSLGVILYELLTGLRPIDAKRLEKAALNEMIRIIREDEPSKPSTRLSTDESLPRVAAQRQIEPRKLMNMLRGELDWVVMKCLEKHRERRYETASGLARDIERYLADEPVEARPPSVGYRMQKFVSRNNGQVIAASLVLLALLAGMAGTTWGLFQARQQETEARRQEQIARGESLEKEKARKAEAARADGERLAKLEAERKRRDAETNLGYAKKGNEILGSVFKNLDPKQNFATVAELRDALKANLSKAVQDLEGTAIGDPLTVAEMQNTLGLSLLGLGAAEQAIPVLKKARETRKANLGAEHPDTLSSMNILAAAFTLTGKPELAMPLLEETVKLSKANLGPEHPDTLACINNLAAAYIAAGKIDLALPLLEETLRQKKAKLGPEHPDTLSGMNNLAAAFSAAGKRDLALSLTKETLTLRKANLGPDHPDTLTSMWRLADLYQADGKLDLALPLLEETLKLQKAKLGPEHPHTLGTMSHLAVAYNAAGKRDLALPLLEESLKLKKVNLGPEHPETIISMNNLAAVYWQTQQLDKSIPLFEQTLERRAAVFGRDHLDTQMVVANLGVNFKDAGRLKEAIPLLEEAHRAAKKYLALSWVDEQLCDAYARAGENAKLASLLQEQLSDARKSLPTDSPQLAGMLAQIGLGLLKQKKGSEAEPLLRECIAIREKQEPDDWRTFNTKSMLGQALMGQKKFAEAEPLLRAGYDGMKQREKMIPPQIQVRLPEAIERLVQLYDAMDRKDEAAKWRRELEQIRRP